MLGDNIKELRNNKGIYQQELADALSVSKSTVAMWETNKREPDLNMIKKIAAFFNVSIDYLSNNNEKNDKEDNETDRIKVLFRHLQNVPDDDREHLIDNLESTIDIYLRAKGLK